VRASRAPVTADPSTDDTAIILDEVQEKVNATKRRCKATSRSGERCRAHVINAAGYCVAHDPEKPMDMSRLGKLSGEARRRPNPERVHESLRAYLKREVAPAEVWAALKLAMEGQNESARVAASRVLMDALAEPQREDKHEYEVFAAAASAKVEAFIQELVETVVRRLLTTGEPDTLLDPGGVRMILERLEADERLTQFLERLKAERDVEQEIARRVAEQTVDLERERAELAAQREEFTAA
jgi:murein L,D-transpeptidase YcbB/YkuD